MKKELQTYKECEKQIIKKENEIEKINMQLEPLNERLTYLKSVINKSLTAKLAIGSFIFYELCFYGLTNWLFSLGLKSWKDLFCLTSVFITFFVSGLYIADSHHDKKVIKEYERKEPNHICENVKEAKILLKGLEKANQKLEEEKITNINAISILKTAMQEEKDRLFLKNMLMEMKNTCNILDEINKKEYVTNIDAKFNDFVNVPICERTLIDKDLYQESYQELEEPMKLTFKNK